MIVAFVEPDRREVRKLIVAPSPMVPQPPVELPREKAAA